MEILENHFIGRVVNRVDFGRCQVSKPCTIKCLEGYVYFFGMLKGFPHDVFAHSQEFHVNLLFFSKDSRERCGECVTSAIS